MFFVSKDSFDVPRAMKHADDLDAIVQRAIEDYVGANYKAAQVHSQIMSKAAAERLHCQNAASGANCLK
jgi:hypothetical protein